MPGSPFSTLSVICAGVSACNRAAPAQLLVGRHVDLAGVARQEMDKRNALTCFSRIDTALLGIRTVRAAEVSQYRVPTAKKSQVEQGRLRDCFFRPLRRDALQNHFDQTVGYERTGFGRSLFSVRELSDGNANRR